MQVAAVRQRTSFAEATFVESVEKEAGTSLGCRRLVDDPRSRRGAHHHRGPPAGDAAGADVRAGAVAERRPDAGVEVVGERRELRRRQSERGQRLLVPGERVRVEEPGAARGRHARACFAAQSKQQVVAEREVARGFDAVACQALDLRGPVRRMEEAAGPVVIGHRIEERQLAGAIAPGQHRCQGPVVRVDGDQRVPEARDRQCVAFADLREHRPAGVDEVIGIELGVREVRVAWLCRPGLVVRDRGTDDEPTSSATIRVRRRPLAARAGSRRGTSSLRRTPTSRRSFPRAPRRSP